MKKNRIAIAGGGIAGLTSALFLAKQGFSVDIFEASPVLSEVGAGLQLSPNACHCLAEIGLLGKLEEVATKPEGIMMMSGRSGKPLTTIPLGEAARQRYDAPYLVIHRADLQSVLREAAEENPSITLALGSSVENIRETDSELFIKLGTEEEEKGAYSLLIGADGVWSSIRTNVLDLSPAVHSGRVAYRATIPAKGLGKKYLVNTGLWLGDKAHVVHYPVQNGKALNIVVLTVENWTAKDWSHPADRAQVLEVLKAWPDDVRSLVNKATNWTRWALCGVIPGEPLVKGRVALVGDAAHAMLPFMAQGAAMGIEDAAVLASHIQELGPEPDALIAYQTERQPRVNKVAQTALRNEKIYHQRMPASLARDMVLKNMPADKLLAGFDWIYEWKPQTKARTCAHNGENK
ncbi:hypothetical protein E1162_19080 [Rhodobacteraceae bacterium RKSG542]|uniref:FAD-dependent monooxygenase n=1 Tax=Pseudovibrio flavus TaxID=2529854 RepID=UPI0012BBB16B|nr:FAD-dependent monooxygenase [Pseudovibrio flavus]MTI19351.1 hypothetical protein [Pseudovibrio flavus]